jgi:hypothetical protein
MTHHRLSAALALTLLAAAAKADAQPVQVFVTSPKSPKPAAPTEADRKQASAAYDAADAARKALEKTLKAQHGNKRDKWPAEAQERLADAEENRNRLNAEWQYWRDAEPVDDFWGPDIAKAMTQSGKTGRKEHVTPVTSAAGAHLIVTVTAVRNPSAAINAADDRCLAIRVERGPKVSAAQFSSIPRTYRPGRAKALRLAGPNDDSPFWRFEGCGLYPYFLEDEAIANIVDDFAGAHLAVLTGAAAGQ